MTGVELRCQLISILGTHKVYPNQICKMLYDINKKTGRRETWTEDKCRRMLYSSQHVSSQVIEQITEKLGLPAGVLYNKNIKRIDESRLYEMQDTLNKALRNNEALRKQNQILSAESETQGIALNIMVGLQKHKDILLAMMNQQDVIDIQAILTEETNVSALPDTKKKRSTKSSKKSTTHELKIRGFD